MLPTGQDLEEGGVYSYSQLASISPSLARYAREEARRQADHELVEAMERISKRGVHDGGLVEETSYEPTGVPDRKGREYYRLGDRLKMRR